MGTGSILVKELRNPMKIMHAPSTLTSRFNDLLFDKTWQFSDVAWQFVYHRLILIGFLRALLQFDLT